MKKLIIAALLAGSFGLCHVAYAQTTDDAVTQAQDALAKLDADIAANPAAAAMLGLVSQDIAPAGDTASSALPKCSDNITNTFIIGSLGNLPQPIKVLSVSNMDSKNSVSNREICVAVLITNVGVQRWDFEYFGSKGTTYIEGFPDSDQTNLDVN
jgi:hypothetical protein